MSKVGISGMTGFGRADGAADGWSWSIEARSVNGRNLEVRFRGPPGFDNLERLAKASGQSRLNRGQVMLTASELADRIGPRLTNSPGMRRAEEWALAKFRAYGLAALVLGLLHFIVWQRIAPKSPTP